MKIIRILLIVLAVLILLAVIAMFALPQNFSTETAKRIDASPKTVFNILNNIENESLWNPWQSQDTSMVVTFGESRVGKGASYTWKSKNMGDGSMEYIDVVKDQKLTSKLNFGGMGEGTAMYTLTPDGDGTLVNWSLDSKSSRPWNLMNFMIKSQTKKSFEQGLKNLNKLATERRGGEYLGYTIKEELVLGKTYVISRGEVGLDQMSEFYAQNLAPLFKKIQAAQVEMSGHPSALVYSYNMKKGTTDMAAGIPIAQAVDIQGASSETIDTRKAVVIDYYGDPKKTETAHYAIDAYMADRSLNYDWPVIEEYVTDPSEEPNPEKWLTRIIYFIAE